MLRSVAFPSALVRWLSVVLTAAACACTFQSQGSHAGPRPDATPVQQVDGAAGDVANVDVSPPCTPDSASANHCLDSGSTEDANPGPTPDCPHSFVDTWRGNACCAPSETAGGWTGPTLVKYRRYDNQALQLNELSTPVWLLGLSSQEGACQCACTTGCEVAAVGASSDKNCKNATPIPNPPIGDCKAIPANTTYLLTPAPCLRKAHSSVPLSTWEAVLLPADNPFPDRCNANQVFLGPPVDDSHLYCLHRPSYASSEYPVCPAGFPVRMIADNKIKPNSRVCSIEACDCKTDGNATPCYVDRFGSREECATNESPESLGGGCINLNSDMETWIRTQPPPETASCSPTGTSRAVGEASPESQTLLCCHRKPPPLAPFSSITTN